MTDLSDNDWLNRRWWIGVLAIWLGISAVMLVVRMPDIAALALGDTDDNLRLAQVRALLGGQAWFDLTQYRLAPPDGANIHWSRLPDLPIAGLILLLEPLLGAASGERWAVALAPLIPLAIGLIAIALIVRRTVNPLAWPIAMLITFCASILMPMWLPLRIDHHGWQLALLAIAIAGLVDPRAARGGATAGIASALSFAIGLEMLIFLALIGAAIALLWVRDDTQSRRMAAYGATLGGGAAIGFALFASEFNRLPVCDALSPVWLSVVAGAGAFLVLLAILPLRSWIARIGAGGVAGAIIALGFALAWPDCLARPEGVSAELQSIWLDNVQEARPVYRQGWRRALLIMALPLSGLAGYAIAIVGARSEKRPVAPIIALAALALVAFTLLFWQVRTAPAAQLLAVPGAAMLGLYLLPRWRRSSQMLVRVGGTFVALFLITGLWAMGPIAAFPDADNDAAPNESASTGPSCPDESAYAPIRALPDATILTTIDMAPRLIVMTRHRGIAGPYHRNGAAMLDVFYGLRGDENRLRETIARYDIGYILICPGMSGEVHYGRDDPGSNYARLLAGDVAAGLEPVSLPDDSPFMLFRVE
ncbi:AcrB/AcrD/AcrF family protein [Parasphingopyxis sp. CP4]|uniref:AcrB/AcrD/AcrF family protein n=1 Tax=Parasphingopyxis sp. CP4 TaxID=2724527 RepID=UPI00159F92CD|nr:AcrB/AcrD/AcrF family protein [Parasphingopyxis sp. CP4]QLC22589.1 AcrB/AcrD/AcrF family protein [Parasphingopyxis sp. CP4]